MNTHILPQFSKIKPENVEAELTSCLTQSRQEIDSLLNQPSQHYTWDNLLAPLEDLDNHLHKLWSPIAHCHAVVNSEAMRKAYQQCIPKLTEYSTEISQLPSLYQGIHAIAESNEFKKLHQAQQKIIENNLRDFKLAGVTLSDEKKQQFKQLKTELASLGNKFEDHILDATDGWSIIITDEKKLSGIPQRALDAAKKAAQEKQQTGWLFNLEFPSYYAVITYADDTSLRQTIYTAYVTRASDQGPHAGKWDNSSIMENIVNKRQELARLLDFNNFAEYSLATKMAESTQQVIDFLQDLVDRSKPQAMNEFQELQQFAEKNYDVKLLNAWDIPYYSEKFRQHKHQISQEELRAYFPASKVIDGMFTIINKLYGLTVKPLNNVDTWHPDVTCYVIFDEKNNLVGHLYMDIYARANKRAGAWMDDCAGRYRLKDNSIQTPIAFLNCNFSSPTNSTPSLLTHDEVLTLFHECGHCLHHLLSKVDYLSVSGINGVVWDAVELPSQFFENWCWEKEALDLISSHYQTNKPLPESLIEKLRAARNFQSAMQMIRQLEFSLFDFKLHMQSKPTTTSNIQALLNEVRQQVSVVPAPNFNRFQHSFSHIFGSSYAAGYYSYKWAEVLASDAYSKFEEQGVFNRKTGEEFKKAILEQGGSRNAMDLFVEFRGRKPKIDALLKHHGIVAT